MLHVLVVLIDWWYNKGDIKKITGYILATPEIGLRLSDNPDLYHRSVSGTEHSCATLPSQGHYTIIPSIVI